MNRSKSLALVAVLIIAGTLCLTIITRQPLELDEVFTLATATGHSLEGLVAAAQPALGDFVEVHQPVPAGRFRRYLEHDGNRELFRVTRAVLLSDTNPPAYYLMLNVWSRVLGTDDSTLRILSVLFSLACIPLVYVLLGRFGFAQASFPAALFMAFAPPAVFFGTIARMYAMMCALSLACVLLTVEFHRRGNGRILPVVWVAMSAAGLLTHYFFAFTWIACVVWLVMQPGESSRRHTLILAGIVTLLILPWYHVIPQSVTAWRITSGWLQQKPTDFSHTHAQLALFARYFLTGGDWSHRYGISDIAIAVVVGTTFLVAVVRRGWRQPGSSVQMLLVWVLTIRAGLIVFDVSQSVYAEHFSRYAFGGMPAAASLLAIATAKLGMRLRIVVISLLLALWVPELVNMNVKASAGTPFGEIASRLGTSDTDKVLVVGSIPSGVLGVARYVDPDTPMVDWVVPLGSRDSLTSAREIVGEAPRLIWIGFFTTWGQSVPNVLGEAALSIVARPGLNFAWYDVSLDRP